MKKFCFVAVFLILSLISTVAFAENRTVLRIGYIADTGFIREDSPGHFEGYGYEYMEFLARYGDYKCVYVPCRSWNEMCEKLKDGEVDIIPAYPGDYRSAPFAKRTDHVVNRYTMGLITKDGKIKPHMKIGYVKYNAPTPSLPKVAKDRGFTYDLIPYHIHYDMIDAFDRDELDAYVAPILEPDKAKNVVADFDRQSYRILVRSDRKELWDSINSAQDAMLKEQFDIREQLQNKYFRIKGVPLILSKAERDYLDTKKVLKVAVQSNMRPYMYYNGSQALGLIPTLLYKMGNDLEIEIEIVRTETRDEALKLIETGSVDMLADMTSDFSWGEKINALPTKSYIILDFVSVHRRGETSLSDVKVALIENQPYSQTYIYPMYPEDKRFFVGSIEDGFRAVAENKADVVYAPRNEVPYIIEATATYNLEAETASVFQVPLAIGINKNANPHLWRIISKEISHIDRSTFVDMMNSSRVIQNITPQWILYHYPLQVFAGFLIIIAIIGGIFYNRYRMRHNHLMEMEKLADTDMRYDLPNLRHFIKVAPELTEKALKKDPSMKFYISILAMDSKAAVALPYGKELLDKQLKTMAEKISERDPVLTVAAGSDSGHLVFLIQTTSDEEAVAGCASCVEEYGYIVTPDARVWLHMQGGVAHFNPENIALSIEEAHVASHEAGNSPTHTQFYDDKLRESLEFDQKIEGCMERCLKEGEFVAWYQPKYDIRTKKITGAEALVRWISKDMGFMPPGKFIPLFEKNGFVIPVDHYILEEVFKFQKRAIEAGKTPVTISVNQSRLHMTEENYLEKIRAMVDKYKLPKGLIELELTETVFGDFDQKRERENAVNIINALKEMGFTISVDDFGSGYSSYTLLNYLPMDVMKIDRSLLVASDDSDRMQSILGNIIELGNLLNMKVICEGIETPEQEELLLKLGCYLGQGYLNSKPLKESEFLKFWEEHV